MTITERNQKLYELRERLLKARAQVAWIEQEIWLTNERYKNQDLDLYKEMFCNWLTTNDWLHYNEQQRLCGLSVR